MTTQTKPSAMLLLHPPGICQVPRCRRRVAVKKHGLCGAHYKRWQRGGTVGTAPVARRRPQRAVVPYQAP